MALNAKLDKLSYKTFVLLGDSEMAEGSVWEAMASAAHYKLNNLVAILDVNRLGQRGETMYGHHTEIYRRKKLKLLAGEAVVIAPPPPPPPPMGIIWKKLKQLMQQTSC